MSLTSTNAVHQQLVGCGKRDLVRAADRLPLSHSVLKVVLERWRASLTKPHTSYHRTPFPWLTEVLHEKRQSTGSDSKEKAPPRRKEKRLHTSRLVSALVLGQK